MDPFRDRVAVITGGASGIGAAMAGAFGARGAKLVLADIDKPSLQAKAAEFESAGYEVLPVQTDVTKLAQVQALRDASVDRFGAVHIVCNNAGIALVGKIAEAPHKDWELTMGVNFWGVVHGVETFAPLLVEQEQGGHIVNTASMAGLVGMSWLGVYCASKFAVVGLSEAMFREMKEHDIGVSVLCPGMVETNIGPNSARTRGIELPKEAPPSVPAGEMKGGFLRADEVAARVVRGIERRDLYILTHLSHREFIRRRAERLEAVFQDESWSEDA